MTVNMIRDTVKAIFKWIRELNERGVHTDKLAAQKATAGLQAMGISLNEKKQITYTNLPTLPESDHVEAWFIKDLRKVADPLLEVYNSYLKQHGQKPIKLAA